MKHIIFVVCLLFFAGIVCAEPQVIIKDGIEYIVDGDYPDGKYVEYVKNRGSEKTVYSKSAFIDRIPKAIRVQIKEEETAGNADVLDWLLVLSLMDEINLNLLPDAFVDGFNNMADNPNINITQNQVNNFLER